MTTKKAPTSFLFTQFHADAQISQDKAKRATKEIDASATKANDANQESVKVAMQTATSCFNNDMGKALKTVNEHADLKGLLDPAANALEELCNIAYQMKHDLVNNKEQKQEVSNTTTFRK